VNNTYQDERWQKRPDDRVDQSGAKSAVCAALIARNRPVGVMTLVHPHPQSFTEQHLDLIKAIADQAGIAVLNARLYAESQEQIKQLHIAHQQYRDLQENLTAMIYHDLRSPLANVSNSLDLLNSYLPMEENPLFQPILDIAQRAIDRIIRLTQSLLDVSKLEAGHPITKLQPVEPGELIQEALEILHPVTHAKDQFIHTEFHEPLPQVMIDREMILRVLINLVENASKYTSNGNPITVGAALTSDEQDREWVEFWVQDTGSGIPPEDCERVFEKFARLSIHREKTKGMGLGLTFCRLAVEGHGGRIWIESELDKGSRFSFILPILHDTM
jgi:signal transduction histidine kinase